MFVLLAIVLGILWVFSFAVYHVTSAAIHLLALCALASLVIHFARRKRTT